MEIKTKYQYTYFIYPYVVNEKKFGKYLSKLFANKNCKLKVFEKEKDWDLYTYFLPKVRKDMFWSFEFSKNRISKLYELDNSMKGTVLAKYPCTIFEYTIDKDIQGKTGKNDGIFFSIPKIEIICFNTGVCFLIIKTTLDEDATLNDVCNFNYKFRDINSDLSRLKSFENIKIQTDVFKNARGISTIIKEITGSNLYAKELNIDTERFITYSYACLGQEDWKNEEFVEQEFYKLVNVEPADSAVGMVTKRDLFKVQEDNHAIYGGTKTSVVLLTSDIDTENYTKLPHDYENKYFYNYIFELYRKLYLKKLNNEFGMANKSEDLKEKFIGYTQKIWIEEVTNEELGSELDRRWRTVLGNNAIYAQVKQKYDILYKNINIEKTTRSNRWIAIILAVLVLINIINYVTIVLQGWT